MKKSVVVLIAVILVAAIAAAVLVGLFRREGGVAFRLVYTGRTVGYLVPVEESPGGRWVGGFGRRATVIRREAAAEPRTFVVDSGGFFGHRSLGTAAYGETLAKYVLKGMDKTGVEVANIDVIDQMCGRKKLMELVSTVSFPFVSASLVDAETDEYVFEPFTVIEKDGLRVAFVGLMDTEYLEARRVREAEIDVSLPPTVERPSLDGFPHEGEGFRVLPFAEALERVEPLLEGRADVFVALSPSGAGTWEAMYPYRDGRLFNVVLAVTGMPSPPMIQGKIPVYMTGVGGTHVAVVEAVFRGPGSVKCTKWNAIPLSEDVPEDPGLSGLAAEMRASLADIDPLLLVDKIYGPSGDEKYVGAAVCAECHGRIYEIWSKGPHANALESLKKSGARYDPRCLVCHVGDYQAVDGYVSEEATPKMTPINCEVCHGRGSIHVAKGGHGAEARLVVPDPPRCRICHDPAMIRKSGFFELDPATRFEYNTYWPRVRHGRGQSPEGAEGEVEAE